MIRANPLQSYLSLMQARGFCGREVLAGTSITETTLHDSGNVIPLDEYRTIVDNMLQLTGDCGLGFDVGLGTELMHLGTLGYAALSCATVRESIEVGAKYGQTFGFWGRMRLPPQDHGSSIVVIDAPWHGSAAYRFAVEAQLSFFLRVCPLLAGVDLRLEQVRVSYSEPIYSDRYREIFRCPVTFDAEETQLFAPGDWLDAPLKSCDQELNRICRQHLDELVPQIEHGGSITKRVREVLVRRQTGDRSLERVATELGVGPRTLERQLHAEGYSYRKITEEVRLELARKWLGMALPTKKVSYQLGFADVNSFRRAFKRWTGRTIQDFAAPRPSNDGRRHGP